MGAFQEDLTAAIGEFIGTAYFVFMGTGGATSLASATGDAASGLPNLAIPFAFGWSLFVNVWIWCGVSGGVLNPAITIGLMLIKGKGNPLRGFIEEDTVRTIRRGLMYIVAQFLGAIVGAWFISLVLPNSIDPAVTSLAPGISLAKGFFLEMFTTSVLTMAVMMLAVEGHGGFMAPFGIGMALFISAICAGPYTGASLNPARTLGPSVVAHDFGKRHEHWIYYIGTTLGSILAAGYWHLLNLLKSQGIVKHQEQGTSDRKENSSV